MSLPDVDMSNPTSNSGKFMDKNYRLWLTTPPLLLYYPLSSFITIFISIKTDITNHIYHNAT
ncbi:ST43 protein [Escherichia coli DEC12D]|nr:ST43 protein [Escherichia coli DEC12D]